MSINEHPPQHVPVLLEASIATLNPKEGESYLDLTAGYGGHATAFLDRTNNYLQACLVDRDDMAINSLKRFEANGVRLIHDDFASAADSLIGEQIKFDLILVDLGVSSPQLDVGARGFSFLRDGPLDMRMDPRQDLTAEKYINTAKPEELVKIIQRYGEEPLSVARRYVKAIVQARPLHTTRELAGTILQAHVGGWRKTHPATRTFQAIRIHINQELKLIEELLPKLPELLNKGGRVGIISFHSLEDRLVKRYFQEQANSGFESEFDLITKKPISGTEDDHNPRSRSAKLRVAVKK